MAGFDHEPADTPEAEDVVLVARNARYGLLLFAVYLVFYGGFVGLNAFAPETMETAPAAGVNLAILYGFALIVGAFVMALFYGWLCRAAEPAAAHDEEARP